MVPDNQDSLYLWTGSREIAGVCRRLPFPHAAAFRHHHHQRSGGLAAILIQCSGLWQVHPAAEPFTLSRRRPCSCAGRVRTKTVKKASRVIIEKYYNRLTLDFDTNKRISEEVAIIQSKRLRNKIAGFTTVRFWLQFGESHAPLAV